MIDDLDWLSGRNYGTGLGGGNGVLRAAFFVDIKIYESQAHFWNNSGHFLVAYW